MKILVADDETSTRTLMHNLITSWGYDVILASDGNEAWKVIKGEDAPQIAVLDWSMPGKTGVEICSLCAKEGIPIYRILVTAKDNEQDFVYAIDNGAHDFQSKPIVPGILKSRISVGRRFVEWLQETINSEKLAAVGRLVAGISHHFNNLNTPILMYASSILKKQDLDPDVRKKAEKIEKAAEQARDLTDRLMSFASNKNVDKVPVNLNTVVTDTIELEFLHAERMNIRVLTELAPVPDIMAYEGDIRHVVMNLFKNACHALIERPKKTITIKTSCDEDNVYFSINDTGCGMTASQIQNIFSIFYTEKGEFAKPGSPMNMVKGRGLGLYASKSIIAKHGGDISVKSHKNQGSLLTFWLPIAQQKSTSKE